MTDHTFIYGAGSLGKVLFSLIKDRHPVTAFIDDRKNGQQHCGLPIIGTADAPKSAMVYIAITPCIENNYDNIVSSVRELGFCKVLDFFQIMEQEPFFLKKIASTNYLWMRDSSNEMLDFEKIEEFQSLLSDQESKDLLKKIVRFRKDLTPENYIMPDSEIEYLPAQVINFLSEKQVSFIDAGAYTGDTCAKLLNTCKNNNITTKTIYTFELDKNNFRTLRNNTKRLSLEYNTEIINIPAGVWSTDKLVSIEGQTASSMKAEHESNQATTPVYAIDSLLGCSRVNFIKLDIEGAELEALKGARDLITTNKPALAVCLYHRPDDLWRIPLEINKWFPFYKFHLRLHDHLGLSTVLYCIPY